MAKLLTIGLVAKAAEVNIETIRYYQRLKLIDEPNKPLSGYRQYSFAIVERVHFIKRAQKLGFSLKEIADLLAMGDGHCKDIQIRAEEKRDVIKEQIKDLQKLRKTLDVLIQSCETTGNTTCPIVESLSK